MQVALISIPDGAVRVLKTTGWTDRGGRIFFSPDGKRIAYELTSEGDATHSGIFVMSVDAGSESAAVVHPSQNKVMGWSPDGKYLLFASNRSGSVGLWAIGIADGKPHGRPVFMKRDIASTWSLGVTASGTLYTWKNSGSVFVQASAIDLNSGKLMGPSTGVFQRFIESRGWPEWSADGTQLAFQSCGLLGGGPCSLFVWSLKTGQVRQVMHQLDYFQSVTWSPDGREVLAGGNDRKGRPGIYRIVVETGETSRVEINARGNPQWCSDSKGIFYKPQRGSEVILKRDLATGAETEFVRAPALANSFFSVSRDQRTIAGVASDGPVSKVIVISADGGLARTIFQVNAPERLSRDRLTWAPGGRAVFTVKTFDGNERKELWEIPVEGGQPRRVEMALPDNVDRRVRLSADGKHIAFVGSAGEGAGGIWALENVVPVANN